MKKAALFVLITLSTLNSFAQEFEGKIIYSNTYKSKNPQVSDQQLGSMMGSSQEYFIKDGDYKTVMLGKLIQWQLYINTENRLYTKASNSDIIFWNDGSINNDSIISIELNKKVIEILGYTCDELVFNCTSGVQKYYFSNAIKTNVSWFENHKFGNWYDFVKRSNALPLKIIIDSPQLTIACEATEVKEMSLASSTFRLPKDAKTQKSPY